MDKEEKWKDIKGYEGLYQISSLGRVKSLERYVKARNGLRVVKERILTPTVNSSGYLCVQLRKNAVRFVTTVHRLVAIEFYNHIPSGNKLVIDHIDNNKLNNCADNIQIISNRSNLSKGRKNKTSKYVGVSYHKSSNKWMAQIYLNKKKSYLGRFDTEIEAHKAYINKLNTIQ